MCLHQDFNCCEKRPLPQQVLYKKMFNWVQLRVERCSPLLSCHEAWLHAVKHNAGKVAESSKSGSIGSSENH